MLTFQRKLGETLVVEVTLRDRLKLPQSVAGVSDLAVNITRAEGTAVITGDTANAHINENSDPSTTGWVSYRRAPDSTFTLGLYRLEFVATLNGELVKFPEDGYILILFT